MGDAALALSLIAEPIGAILRLRDRASKASLASAFQRRDANESQLAGSDAEHEMEETPCQVRLLDHLPLSFRQNTPTTLCQLLRGALHWCCSGSRLSSSSSARRFQNSSLAA
jgi:hypothetical protein